MKSSKHVDVLVGVLCYLYTVVSIIAECPLNAVLQAQLCTANLGIGPSIGPKPFVEKGQVELAKRACRLGLLDNAVKCLQELMDKCQGNTEREHFLHMMIDVENARDSVKYFCNNLNVYEDNAECISKQHEEQSRCAKETIDNFKTKAKATPNMDVMMTSTCRYFNVAVRCSLKTLKSNCGHDAMNIVVKMLRGFEPPKCKELQIDPGYEVGIDDGTNSAVVVSNRISVLLLSIIVVFFAHRLM